MMDPTTTRHSIAQIQVDEYYVSSRHDFPYVFRLSMDTNVKKGSVGKYNLPVRGRPYLRVQ
jgi:hypothetical protein